ncbi:thioredoxin reductase [Massilia aurea]|uniref:Thioredoxin reductase n=1 Tax=Massilia aurea TaxID=373040 RepID=A0A7W9X3F8_9BURK|nr:NAD(P)/FAD-dependent oxidoreductase [Massilia aurea]MBB6135741.1 thioredoxin reductase [Massilia aurea]
MNTTDPTPASPLPYDAIIIGGSYAGLSAALQLARARRRILVVDAGQRRNRYAANSHGFLTRDGQPAADIAAEGRANVAAYPNVDWHDGTATSARQDGDGFIVELDGADTVRAARLVLATGVRDDLPPIDGLAERWGKSVFHCPYCHGYELNEGRIGVLASGPLSVHQAQMLPHWGQVTLFTNGVCPLDDAQRADLQARGVEIDETPVRRLVNVATVVLEDGRQEIMTGLFTYGRVHMTSPIAEQLGCAFDQGPLGPFIRTDDSRQTTVPAVFAAGDAMRAASTVALSVADGAMAGVGAHRSLLFGVTPFAAPMMPAVASSAPAVTRE